MGKEQQVEQSLWGFGAIKLLKAQQFAGEAASILQTSCECSAVLQNGPWGLMLSTHKIRKVQPVATSQTHGLTFNADRVKIALVITTSSLLA